MFEFKHEIKDELGIHARPAGLLVKEFKDAESDIFFELNGKKANAKSLIGLMSLAAKKGDKIIVRVEGKDEDEIKQRLKQFLIEKM